MSKTIRLMLAAAFVPLAMSGSGCQQQADSKAAAAAGEVLPGTISDAMIDTDRTQGEAPLMPARPSARSVDDTSQAAPDASAPAEDAPVAEASAG